MSMDQGSQLLFDDILRKDVETLTENDLAFLWARQSYLTDDQMRLYEPLMRSNIQLNEVKAEKLDIAKLRHQAKELGIKLDKGMTAPHILALIDQVQFDRELAEEKAKEEQAAAEAKELEAKEAKSHKGNFENLEENHQAVN